MGRFFDGANDSGVTPDNSAPNLDNNDISISLWFQKSNQPVSQIIYTIITQNGGANRYRLSAVSPAGTGFKLDFTCLFSTTPGGWTTGDLALNTRHHIAITYNRSLTTNDPIIYINGAAVSITEVSTPVGTASTGADTVKCGESPTGTADLEGIESHQTSIGGVIYTAADVNRAKWWGRPFGGLHIYQPLITNKVNNEGSETGANYTFTGTSVIGFPVPTVRLHMMCQGW